MQQAGSNVAIFVDVHNMFRAAKMLHQSKLNYSSLLNFIAGNRAVEEATAYIVRKEDVDNSAFHAVLNKAGYAIKVKDAKIHTDPSGEKRVAHVTWCVGISIDMLSVPSEVDTIALVTCDGDYTELVKHVREVMGLRVEVYGFDKSMSYELAHAADQYVPIPETCLFKDKRFVEMAAKGQGKLQHAFN